MKFWDGSAVVPLVLREPTSSVQEELLAADPQQWVWWGTELECVSAISQRERTGDLTTSEADEALDLLASLVVTWREVPPSDHVRRAARRLLRTHTLTAPDALQLAAAIAASENRPETLDLVTLDDRLALAASREGFRVVSA